MTTEVTGGMNESRVRGWWRARPTATAARVAELEARVAELEEAVAECRRHHLRLAELTDVVQELLLPVAQRDEAAVEDVLARYAQQLG